MENPSATPVLGPKRALFYSHDTLGLGHLRRTLLICEGLRARFSDLSTLIVTGSAVAHAFRISEGVDYVKLPSVFKVDNESYASRSLRISFDDVWRLRKQIILCTAKNYKPDLFFVDNVPLGMNRELQETLLYLRATNPRARSFLILRDILDDQRYIVSFWKKSGTYEALEALYDRILICGSQTVYDLAREYGFPRSLLAKTRFCGYIPRGSKRLDVHKLRRDHCAAGEKLVLVTVGGGSDGVPLVEAYLDALPEIQHHMATSSIIVLGPDMDRGEAKRLAARCGNGSRVTILEFTGDLSTYMDAADCVISMAGYNAISEILWFKKKSIVVPRARPRTEQLIRARLLHERGLVEMIHPAQLTPENLARRVVLSLSSVVEPKAFPDFTAIENLAAEVGPYVGESHNGHVRGGVG